MKNKELPKSTFVFRSTMTVILLAALGLAGVSSCSPAVVSADDDVVVDPKSGQRVLVNQLAILAEGQDVRAIVEEYGGTITIAVPETDTYQAKFAVRSLRQLDAIAKKLQKRGLKTQYVLVTKPSHQTSANKQQSPLATLAPSGPKKLAPKV